MSKNVQKGEEEMQYKRGNNICWKADAEKEVIVRVDGSHTRIGAVFLQEDKPAAYALWSLTSAQCSYVQIEKEMFATVAGCENFHQYN